MAPQTGTLPAPASGLSGFLAVVKRWRFMLVAAAVAAAAAGYITASRGEPQYESSASGVPTIMVSVPTYIGCRTRP